jgi:hypothetical protein
MQSAQERQLTLRGLLNRLSHKIVLTINFFSGTHGKSSIGGKASTHCATQSDAQHSRNIENEIGNYESAFSDRQNQSGCRLEQNSKAPRSTRGEGRDSQKQSGKSEIKTDAACQRDEVILRLAHQDKSLTVSGQAFCFFLSAVQRPLE